MNLLTLVASFYPLEIIGTKDYRKPEWVSHMEEMQEAMKGNVNLELILKMFKCKMYSHNFYLHYQFYLRPQFNTYLNINKENSQNYCKS